MVQVSATPSAAITTGAIYYRFDLDQAQYFGAPVSSGRFADEIDVYLNRTINEKVSAYTAYRSRCLPKLGATRLATVKPFISLSLRCT